MDRALHRLIEEKELVYSVQSAQSDAGEGAQLLSSSVLNAMQRLASENRYGIVYKE